MCESLIMFINCLTLHSPLVLAYTQVLELTGPSLFAKGVKSEDSLIKAQYFEPSRTSLHHFFVAIVKELEVEWVPIVYILLHTANEFIAHIVGLVSPLDCGGGDPQFRELAMKHNSPLLKCQIAPLLKCFRCNKVLNMMEL